MGRKYGILSSLFMILFFSNLSFGKNHSIPPLKKSQVKVEHNISQSSLFIDATVKNLNIDSNKFLEKDIIQLFTHGQPGYLLIEDAWLNPSQIKEWLLQHYKIEQFKHLNIYGCNFGQGKKGEAAVAYLEKTLGITVAASDDITGIDGDWDLEVGTPITNLSFPNYQGNLQGYIDCATILADDDDYNLSNNNASPVRIIDGYTYVATHTTGYGTQELPVVNGEPYHNASGNNAYDSYLAVFDPACNQLLGTYVGGSDDDDIIAGMDVDADGNIIVTGWTASTDFPTTDGSAIVGTYSTFVRKYALDGTLLFSTIIPTETFDNPTVIVDGTDYYIMGENNSATFPTTDGTTLGSDENAYIAKYDGNNNLVYLTQTGAMGDSGENLAGLVLNGDLYVLGETEGPFPTTDGTTVSGSRDAVLMKYDPLGNLVFSTVYGGEAFDLNVNYDIITDGNAIYIASATTSDDFPTTDGSAPEGAFRDAYLRKYDLDGNLIFSKLFANGSNSSATYDLQYVNNAIYLIMDAGSGLPVVGGATNAGGADAYLLKLDTEGNILFSTYYGGPSTDEPSDFYVNASGEVYFLTWSGNAVTTDGTAGDGTAIVKLNADGSLCMASHLNDNPFNFLTERFNVIGDTVYIVNAVAEFYGADNYSTDGSTMFPNDGYDLQLTKFVFCPAPTPIVSNDLTPSSQTVCQNGLVDQIFGEEQVIDGSTFPQLFDQGAPLNQADIELKYQWQVSNSAGGPWTDITGIVAQQKNYTPPPTTSDQFYRRLTKTAECCGGTTVSTSSLSLVLVSGDTAPLVDAGGTFYTCPGNLLTIEATVSGGTPGYTYNWDNGTFTVEDPAVSPTESTVYTLIATDMNGCMQADQATVVVYAADAGDASAVCAGVGTTIGGAPLAGVPVVASGDSPPLGIYSIQYDWSPATGLSCTDCPNPTATPATDETYTLTVTLNDPDGTTCSTNDMITVPVFSAPSNADFAGRDTVLCLGEMVDLGDAAEPGIDVDFSGGSLTQSSVDGATATIANLTDNDFSTGGHTQDNGIITLDLGSVQTINTIQIAALAGFTADDAIRTSVSTDDVNYTIVVNNNFSGYSATSLTAVSIPTQDVRYIRFSTRFTSRDVSISEVRVSLDYVYSWTPGQYIATSGSMATFDAGNLEMPTNNPITYTLNSNIGSCNFYDQVTVAVIEARADEDGCGPRTVGEPDRTPNINETYSWVKITDAGITTGTGDFLGAMDEAIVPVSASTGGDVGYELTVTYTLPSGATGMCKDTVIVPPLCGPGCDLEVVDGGCPDFDNGSAGLIGIPPNTDDPNNWTYSWTSNEGMVGLDSYTTQMVNLTDNGDRRYYVTFTSVIDPTYTCVDSIDVNSAVFSEPTYTAASPVATCNNVAVNIGDPANNSGLTYEWSNADKLNDATISYPEATVSSSTQFTVTVTDNITGCQVIDTVQVNVPDAANAGPDLVVCDNGIVTIGANPAQAGYTYSWAPAGADWRNGTDENDAMPEAFVATTQTFTLTQTDPSGMCVTMDDVEVIVEPLPPSFTLPDLTFCPSQTDALVLGTDDGTSTGTNQVPTGFTYAWTPALVSAGTAINPTVNTPLPSTSTTYEIVVSNTNGCSVRTTQTINPTIGAPTAGGNQTICVGESAFIGDASNPTGGGETYSWSPTTDLSDPTSPNPEYSPSVAGTTTFTLTKTVGGCSSTADVTIIVNEVTAPMLTPQTVCEGTTAQIGVANDPNLQYDWFPTTDLDDATISNPTFSGTSSTNYTLTVIDGNGCTAEASTSVTVNPAPAITISLPDTTICDANATSIVINAGVDPAGSYAYQWSPTTNLGNPNALNPEFFIPGEGDYVYTLEIIDQGTGCSLFESTTMSVRSSNIPEVVAFAIQPSCVDNVAQSDGYLQISQATFADRYHWSTGSTFDDNGGVNTFANATDISTATYPLQIVTGQSNPTGSQDYTIRVYSGAADCFTDVVVTMQEQDCSIGCECTETVYLNEISNGGSVHKFSVNPVDGALTEILTNGNVFYPGAASSELPSPHGLGLDLNGNIYVGATVNSDIRKISPDGAIVPASTYSISTLGQTNIVTNGNNLYYNANYSGSAQTPEIVQVDICTGQNTGNTVEFDGVTIGNADWGLHFNPDTETFYSGTSILNRSAYGIWIYKESDFDNDPLTTVPMAFSIAPQLGAFPNTVAVRGVTTDPQGNIYVVLQHDGSTNSYFDFQSRILKYGPAPSYTFLAESVVDMGTDPTDPSQFHSSVGIIYSNTSGLIYVSTTSAVDDCVSIFDTDLNYLRPAVPSPGNSSVAKGIAIVKECCPTNNNITIDTALCNATINDTLFLQDLISCLGIIGEGTWEADMGNTDMTFNPCNNSITIDALSACGTFTLSSDGTGNTSQCGAFKITVNIETGLTPEAKVFAIQPSCTDGMINNDGYLQLSAITNADRINWSIGDTYTGDTDYANAIDVSTATFPYIITTNLSNPSGTQDYTIRLFNDSPSCNGGCVYTDIVVTMNEQDCTVGCDCEDYLYVNEPSKSETHKFLVNGLSNALTEINPTGPWYPNGGVSELIRPHGLGTDLNGFLYIGETNGTNGINGTSIRKLTCDGEIFPESEFNIPERILNMSSIDNYLVARTVLNGVRIFDACTGVDILGERVCFERPSGATGGTGWAIHIDENDQIHTASNQDNGYIYKFSLEEAINSIQSGSCINPIISGTASAPLFESNSSLGITTDSQGDIFVVDAEFAMPGKIRKFSLTTGTLLAETAIDNTEGDGGWYNVTGLAYSPSCDCIYSSNGTLLDDCISTFDTNLNALGAAVGPVGGNPSNNSDAISGKAIGYNSECCPTNNNITIDTVLCSAALNDTLLLQDLINCSGTICEGFWQEGGSNTGLTYNVCNNSVTIDALSACGSFTLESDGTGNNPQCGAFKITVNIEVGNVIAPIISGTQPTCATNNDPPELTIDTPATGSQTISYLWQSSTSDCTSDFTDIAGAPTDGTAYDPPTLTQETYYRVISSVNGNCATGMCVDTSNCVRLTPEDSGSLCLDQHLMTPTGDIHQMTWNQTLNGWTAPPDDPAMYPFTQTLTIPGSAITVDVTMSHRPRNDNSTPGAFSNFACPSGCQENINNVDFTPLLGQDTVFRYFKDNTDNPVTMTMAFSEPILMYELATGNPFGATGAVILGAWDGTIGIDGSQILDPMNANRVLPNPSVHPNPGIGFFDTETDDPTLEPTINPFNHDDMGTYNWGVSGNITNPAPAPINYMAAYPGNGNAGNPIIGQEDGYYYNLTEGNTREWLVVDYAGAQVRGVSWQLFRNTAAFTADLKAGTVTFADLLNNPEAGNRSAYMSPFQFQSTCPDQTYQVCDDGSTSEDLTVDAAVTSNVVWFNEAGTQVGTGNTLTVSSATDGMSDGTEIFSYTGTDVASGCDGASCCPIIVTTMTCQTYSLGNQVFTDTDNSGDLNGLEAGIDGVQLQLLNGDGSVYDSDPNMVGDQALIVTTANGGYYRFDDLPMGDYIVEVIASNFNTSNPLNNLTSSTGPAQEADPNTNGDSNDNGLDALVSGAIRSGVVTLSQPEPTGEIEPSSYDIGSTTGTAAIDAFSNLTVDFGFHPIPVCALTLTQNAQSACNDNGTTPDASDDYFTMTFNATIANGGAQYEVVTGANADGTGGTVLATANYGSPIIVGDGTNGATGIFLADGTTTYDITIRDATTNTCHQDFTSIAVNSCSASLGFDYSDYNRPGNSCINPICHIISNDIYLGSGVTSDNSNSGDQNANSDFDDGINISSKMQFTSGGTVRIPVSIYNNTGTDAYLRMWIDWNGDGDFEDADELIEDNTYASTGTTTNTVLVAVTIPLTATQGQQIALRARISTDDVNSADPCGTGTCAADGEVEDYLLEINCPTPTCLPVQLSRKN